MLDSIGESFTLATCYGDKFIVCKQLGYLSTKCKFEFNNFNSGNISNIQQVHAKFFFFFFIHISCVLYQTTLFFILEMIL